MENLFEFVIWLIFIAVFWLLPALAKKKAGRPPEAERKPYPLNRQPEMEEKILEALGFPVPRPLPPPVYKVKKIPQAKPIAKAPEIITKAPAAAAAVKVEEKITVSPLTFTADKLQEGIILSTILSPPKAYTFLPGWWNARPNDRKI